MSQVFLSPLLGPCTFPKYRFEIKENQKAQHRFRNNAMLAPLAFVIFQFRKAIPSPMKHCW
jgi:hypothetical protein